MSFSCIWDGFDDYNNSSGEKWDVANGTPAYSSSYARFPAAANCVAQGMRLQSGVYAYKMKNFLANVALPIASFAFLFETMPSTPRPFMAFGDNGTYQISVALNPNGSLSVYRSNGGTLLGTSGPGLVTNNTYYFLDVVATIAGGTSGSVSVYLSTPAGGSAVLTVTGVNTSQSGNAYANQFTIGFINNSSEAMRVDDLHVHDASGSAPNAALGEGTRIYTKVPTGAGYATTWTPNGASANWQCVDDCPPDGDTTYNSAASGFPLIEGYAIGAAGFTGTVNGVVRDSYVRKDDSNAHTFENGVRSSSTNGFGSAVAVLSTYAWIRSFFANDPNTSAAWTAAGADAAAPVIDAAS